MTRYVARYGKGRVAKAVLISAIPPTFMKSDRNPDGVPREVVDGIRDGTANHRSQFYIDITLPFYGFNRPLKSIDIPVLVMHGEDDQICPFPTTGARSVKLLKRGTLKSYPGLPHGMPTTHAEQINADLLGFIKAG